MTIGSRTTPVVILLAALACVPSCVMSFAPLSAYGGVRTIGRSPASSLKVATAGDRQADAVLRQIEKKQQEAAKRKEQALAQVNQADEYLAKLETKRKAYLEGLQLAEPPGSFSETTARSAIKAFCWRVVAGSVTFVTSLQFSGSVKTALSIVGSDFFSKAFTMFVGERLMNKSQAGRKSGSDDVGRSLAKALVWRLFAIANTLTMAIFIAKDISVASKIAGSDAVFKTALMFVYERIWANVEWGKEYIVEFSI